MGVECALLIFKAWFYLCKYPGCRLLRLQSKLANWCRGRFTQNSFFAMFLMVFLFTPFFFMICSVEFQLIYLTTYCVKSVSLILKLVQNDCRIYENNKGKNSICNLLVSTGRTLPYRLSANTTKSWKRIIQANSIFPFYT